MAPGGVQSPWEILGVPRDADPAAIKKAFRLEARKWHPDKRPQGESEEDALRARSHFLAIQGAYEALLSGAAQASAQEATTFDHVSSYFSCYTKEALVEARAAREEAEEYVKELREQTLQDYDWTEEEQKELEGIWSRAFLAVQVLRQKEQRIQVMMEFDEKIQETKSRPKVTDPTPKKAALGGPRTMSDRFHGVGEAFGEIFEDLGSMASYFSVFRAVKQARSESDD
eukprot:TRINITY_DN109434_c0_g1_i1.p1 TRINITY_DN109434_c0_g1~~TRINITY_DN109434_c0_g1_i1.p1  ORF type:complete len:245 (+),score=63.52 TRINITY_DN109434_c0_g1_i1:53-736(+)